jgi:hypothetical protein
MTELQELFCGAVQKAAGKESEKTRGIEVVGGRPRVGFVEGLIKAANNGIGLGSVLVTTAFSTTASSAAANGYYSFLCLAGRIGVTFKATNWIKKTIDIEVGEGEYKELYVDLQPENKYRNTYDVISWAFRGNDNSYELDLCDVNTGAPLSGCSPVRGPENNFVAWSPRNYVELTLGMQTSQLAGFQFKWKVRSASGYGGSGYEGIITVPAS